MSITSRRRFLLRQVDAIADSGDSMPESSASTDGDTCELNANISPKSKTDEDSDGSNLMNDSNKLSNDEFTSDFSDSDISDITDPVSNEAPKDLSYDLANWSTSHNISQSALGDLLVILRGHDLKVPKCARTLHGTPKTIDIKEVAGGDYIYFGLESGITQTLRSDSHLKENCRSIELKVNIDGIPLYKSNTISMWPILCCFKSSRPFAVCLFSGVRKPNPVEAYLNDFLTELRELQVTGIRFEGRQLNVKLHSFVCDAPARQMLKKIKGHTGYFSCERCVIKGYRKDKHLVIHSATEEQKRIDSEFDRGMYRQADDDNIANHQIGLSPLIGVIPCVSKFVLDYMHLVCLGVVKRIISYWKIGNKTSKKGKLTHGQLSLVAEKLQGLRLSLPSDFSRQPRSILEVEHWKATEFRQFLLYTGPVVLRGVLRDDYYSHFASLTVAMSVLLNDCDELRSAYIPYARDLLQYFVRKSSELYSDCFISYNVHSLVHLPDDCVTFQSSLNSISAFSFENYLRTMKQKVRGSQKPLVQVAKRLVECSKLPVSGLNRRAFKRISTSDRDGCFLLGNNSFAFVKEVRDNGLYVCDIVRKSACEEFFEEPLRSLPFGIAFCTKRALRSSKRSLVNRNDFSKKAMWSRAVWREGKAGRIYSDAIPTNWIQGKVVFWPKKGVESKFKKRAEPDVEEWKQFQLLKFKFSTNSLNDARAKNVDTGAEENTPQTHKRQHVPKSNPNFVSWSNTEDSTEEKEKRENTQSPVLLPPFPKVSFPAKSSKEIETISDTASYHSGRISGACSEKLMDRNLRDQLSEYGSVDSSDNESDEWAEENLQPRKQPQSVKMTKKITSKDDQQDDDSDESTEPEIFPQKLPHAGMVPQKDHVKQAQTVRVTKKITSKDDQQDDDSDELTEPEIFPQKRPHAGMVPQKDHMKQAQTVRVTKKIASRTDQQDDYSDELPEVYSRKRPHAATVTRDNGYPMSEERFQRKVFQKLCDLGEKVDNLAKRHDMSLHGFTFNPCQSLKELMDLDRAIVESNGKKQAVLSIFKKTGGFSVREQVGRIMGRLFTHDLKTRISLRGRKQNKFPFVETTIFRLVIEAVANCHPESNDKMIETAISNHLKYAPFRAHTQKKTSDV